MPGLLFIDQPEEQGFDTSRMAVQGEDIAGLKPLPVNRMLTQAGKPMNRQRAKPGLFQRKERPDPALHDLVIRAQQRVRDVIDNWSPMRAEDAQRLNNTNPSPRSKPAALTGGVLRRTIEPYVERLANQARSAGAFASSKDDKLLPNKYDVSSLVDDKMRQQIRQQVFSMFQADRVKPGAAGRSDLRSLVFSADLRSLGDQLVDEYNNQRTGRTRDDILDMLEIRRQTIKPI